MSEELQAHAAFLTDLPPQAIQAVQAYDPDGSAVWWLLPIVNVSTPRPASPRRSQTELGGI